MQYTHSLKDIIGAPPIPPFFDEDLDSDSSGYEAEGECEGSAFPSMMRKLVSESSPEVGES